MMTAQEEPPQAICAIEERDDTASGNRVNVH
jgi:hypothetical protein